jgi:2-C-methyl-D-erythritol 2,4-cyclodiphosphate synthase
MKDRTLVFRVGFGEDSHRLVPARPLVLGGVRIPFELGLAGHSDADVVLHAVADALLGAAGLGDIGELFPDRDPTYKDVDSAQLLGDVLQRVRAAGWEPVNVDLVIHAQRPSLSAYKAPMQKRIAELLGISPSAVGVKAKTGEGVGSVGRGEVIRCHAVVLLALTASEVSPAQGASGEE